MMKYHHVCLVLLLFSWMAISFTTSSLTETAAAYSSASLTANANAAGYAMKFVSVHDAHQLIDPFDQLLMDQQKQEQQNGNNQQQANPNSNNQPAAANPTSTLFHTNDVSTP